MWSLCYPLLFYLVIFLVSYEQGSKTQSYTKRDIHKPRTVTHTCSTNYSWDWGRKITLAQRIGHHSKTLLRPGLGREQGVRGVKKGETWYPSAPTPAPGSFYSLPTHFLQVINLTHFWFTSKIFIFGCKSRHMLAFSLCFFVCLFCPNGSILEIFFYTLFFFIKSYILEMIPYWLTHLFLILFYRSIECAYRIIYSTAFLTHTFTWLFRLALLFCNCKYKHCNK